MQKRLLIKDIATGFYLSYWDTLLIDPPSWVKENGTPIPEDFLEDALISIKEKTNIQQVQIITIYQKF